MSSFNATELFSHRLAFSKFSYIFFSIGLLHQRDRTHDYWPKTKWVYEKWKSSKEKFQNQIIPTERIHSVCGDDYIQSLEFLIRNWNEGNVQTILNTLRWIQNEAKSSVWHTNIDSIICFLLSKYKRTPLHFHGSRSSFSIDIPNVHSQ